MGKISPFEIFGATFSNTLRWMHFFLPIAVVSAFIGAVLNGYVTEMLMPGSEPSVPSNFWWIWGGVMLAILTVQVVQVSLFDAVMEQKQGWATFGVMRALRRVVPTIIGMIVFMVAYVLGTVMLIIPGVMVLFLLYMMMPLILIDDVNPFAAVKRSWQLTWGNAWRLFAAIIVTFLPIMLVIAFIGTALGFVSIDPHAPPQLPDWSTWQAWAWVLVTGVVGALVTSFYLVTFRALKTARSQGGSREELVSA